jgi:hypothetical protein
MNHVKLLVPNQIPDLNEWVARLVFCKRVCDTSAARQCIAVTQWRMLVLLVCPSFKAVLSMPACLVRDLRESVSAQSDVILLHAEISCHRSHVHSYNTQTSALCQVHRRKI